MSEMTVTFPGGKRVDAHFKGKLIATDQPEESGGGDSAPSPFSLFLASLATCAGYYVLAFCQSRGLSVEGIRLTQRHEFDPKTHALSGVEVLVHLPATFPDQYREALVRAADGCAVKKVLTSPPRFEVRTLVG